MTHEWRVIRLRYSRHSPAESYINASITDAEMPDLDKTATSLILYALQRGMPAESFGN